jgi:hypothetical protein
MEKISDRIINKAVDLWCKKLVAPSFDNGDKSERGFMAAGLTGMVVEKETEGIHDMADRIEKFRAAVTDELIRLRDNPGKDECFSFGLDTDYHPCRILAEAAEKAGIPESLFSWKSSVSMREDYVSTSFGYVAPYIRYYPLSDGRWLVIDLTGYNDMQKVIDSVVNGDNPLGLTIQKEQD